ncbi:unnamed protein product [Miscanthus lutarioriparius]|uniref:BHLH domain-containing protein n=1 Tax=Miscanthus lutarioriparius TaxID=422564 RepID=A0A811R5T0_9POAL|nr:unnamed protein product [Miscanthus lutarioriparius]
MWEGGGIHGSHHEALLLQAAGSGAADYGHGGGPASFMPWLGSAAASEFSYMAPHHAHQPGPLGTAEAAAASPFGFGGGGWAELGRMTAKEIMDAKALAASRSHSEAERRRRQRINSHLARLRSLLPNTTKTDKASLLAEVIEHVKELKRQTSAVLEGEEPAAAARQHLQLLPTEADDLAVDAAEDGDGRLVVRASLCCEDRVGLIPDIARALAALRLRAHRAEIATLGGRVRNVLLITADDDEEEEEGGEGQGDDGDDVGEACPPPAPRRPTRGTSSSRRSRRRCAASWTARRRAAATRPRLAAAAGASRGNA